MSGWANHDPRASGGRQPGSWLDRIPGYSGYRNKESRRDEDKRLREELARQYATLADRLTGAQGELVRAGRLTEIGALEQVERSLRRFSERLRVATYGYGGLFSDRPIDERALDQLQRFDRGLGDGAGQLEALVATIETAARSSGDLAGPVGQARDLVDTLNRRFDLRGEVVTTGEPQPEATVASVFGAEPTAQPHQVDDLHFGDAISIAASDYLVDGRIEVHAEAGAWRQFLLRDGQTERWLHVPPSTAEPLALLEPLATVPDASDQVTLDGQRFARTAGGEATAELVGAGTRQPARQLRYRRYQSADGQQLLFIYDWGAERQALRGRLLDPLEVTVYPRQPEARR